MKYFVFWSPEADDALQQLIKEGSASLVRSVREIYFWLARGPLDFGERGLKRLRLGVVTPLAVLFDVLDDPPTVIVLDRWRF